MCLDSRETATVLAALRYWQEYAEPEKVPPLQQGGEWQWADPHFDADTPPLSDREIDDLCEKINTAPTVRDLTIITPTDSHPILVCHDDCAALLDVPHLLEEYEGAEDYVQNVLADLAARGVSNDDTESAVYVRYTTTEQYREALGAIAHAMEELDPAQV